MMKANAAKLRNAPLLAQLAWFIRLRWIAGAVVIASSLVALGVHSAGFTALEWQPGRPAQDDPPADQPSFDHHEAEGS